MCNENARAAQQSNYKGAAITVYRVILYGNSTVGLLALIRLNAIDQLKQTMFMHHYNIKYSIITAIID